MDLDITLIAKYVIKSARKGITDTMLQSHHFTVC